VTTISDEFMRDMLAKTKPYAPEEEVVRIMDEDPVVKAGIFTYELHPTRSFPGDSLPA
jgi:hypothetical protein